MFTSATHINNPLALTAFFFAVICIIIRTLIKKDKTNAKTLHTVSLFLVIGGLVMGILAITLPYVKDFSKPLTKKEIHGTVYVDGKIANNIVITAPQLEREDETNQFGRFVIPVDPNFALQTVTLEFTNKGFNIDSFITIQTSTSDTSYRLRSKRFKILQTTVKTFSISPLNLTQLNELVRKKGYTLLSNHPDYRIVLTHTGNIEIISNGLYFYRGGYVELKINDQDCFTFKNLSLDPTFEMGNTCEFVDSSVSYQIISLVNNNIYDVFEKINKCL